MRPTTLIQAACLTDNTSCDLTDLTPQVPRVNTSVATSRQPSGRNVTQLSDRGRKFKLLNLYDHRRVGDVEVINGRKSHPIDCPSGPEAFLCPCTLASGLEA